MNLDAYQKDLGIEVVYGEKGYSQLTKELLSGQRLDVNGIWGGYIGEGAKTVLPSQALCENLNAISA